MPLQFTVTGLTTGPVTDSALPQLSLTAGGVGAVAADGQATVLPWLAGMETTGGDTK